MGRSKPAPTQPHQLALPLDFTAPASTPPTSTQRRIVLGEHVLSYALRRSRRRSIGFLIDDDGLRITAPKWVTLTDIENAIREKQRWIFNKLNEYHERCARRVRPPMQWRDGATLAYLGADLTLRILATQANGITYDEARRELTICLPANSTEQQLKDRVQGWLQGQAQHLFAQRLPLYAEKLQVAYRSFALSCATTQWGSCTADGKIRLNWRLIHFTLPLIDYVIAHELAHLHEMNHSPRFWEKVQSVFPEFQTARKTLREQAPETLSIF